MYWTSQQLTTHHGPKWRNVARYGAIQPNLTVFQLLELIKLYELLKFLEPAYAELALCGVEPVSRIQPCPARQVLLIIMSGRRSTPAAPCSQKGTNNQQ
ncbi:hypothetical protein EJ02DRAFT_100725 [Clathrospora elynae]|uniref:Uncharacterized protein n=1 Tax=Clathrospora elynae TaxID=706981 RepID=A0A6A5T148_9PLEO|nr:hypothetical protein EJ02DRAFT_100725 [Clathrospora elynae]